MEKQKRLLSIFGISLLLILMALSGCGGEKTAAKNEPAKVDVELQGKVKGYSESVAKPLEDLIKTLDKVITVYQDLGYQRIDKEGGRKELNNALADILSVYDLLIAAADKYTCPEVDEVVSYIHGAIYREKESLIHIVGTDLNKAELNQSIETIQDSQRQIEKGLRNLDQLKQSFGLGEN